MNEEFVAGPTVVGSRHLVTIYAAAAPDVVERVAGELRRRRCVVDRLAYVRLSESDPDTANGAGPAPLNGADPANGALRVARVVALVGARDIHHVAARLRRLPDVLDVTWTPAA